MATEPNEVDPFAEEEIVQEESPIQPESAAAIPATNESEADIDLRLWKVAQHYAASDLAPPDYRGKPDNAFIAMKLGHEVGLKSISAVQNICVIKGRPSLWGDAMLAVCQRSGLFDTSAFDERKIGKPYEDNYTAVCTVKRFGQNEPTVRTYSVADAKRAKLWAKQGPWQTDPKRMLQMRARAFALRDTFADVLKGLYMAEELTGAEAVDRVLAGIDVTKSNGEIRKQLSEPPEEPSVADEPEPEPSNDKVPSPKDIEERLSRCRKFYGELDAATRKEILDGFGISSPLKMREIDDLQLLDAIGDELSDAVKVQGGGA